MKITASVTVETKDGDKMMPATVDIGEVADGNVLRNLVHQELCAVLNRTMVYDGSRVRAVSLVVEA